MSAIRPDLTGGLPASATPSPGPAASAARAAQAAFFRAALGEAQAGVAAGPQTAPAADRAETARAPRPGQLLDIRV